MVLSVAVSLQTQESMFHLLWLVRVYEKGTKHKEINIDWLLTTCFMFLTTHHTHTAGMLARDKPLTASVSETCSCYSDCSHSLMTLMWILALAPALSWLPTCWPGHMTAPEPCLCQYIWHVQSQLLAGESAI